MTHTILFKDLELPANTPLAKKQPILCVPRTALYGVGFVYGFNENCHEHYDRLLVQGGFNYTAWWAIRYFAEIQPPLKQVIPYIVVSKIEGERQYLTYSRSLTGGEQMLHGQMSLGIGGHIDMPEDMRDNLPNKQFPREPYHFLLDGAVREIEEEIGVKCDKRELKLRGIVNHDDTPVGEVHVGFVYELTIDKKVVLDFDDDSLHEPTFLGIAEIFDRIDEFEGWSQFVIRYLHSRHSKLQGITQPCQCK